MFFFFSLRPVDCIRGFSRETLVEMTTNIESQEYCRRLNNEIGYAEHPGAGGTDDLETFFSIAHHYLGLVFSLEQFKEKWPKLVRYINFSFNKYCAAKLHCDVFALCC